MPNTDFSQITIGGVPLTVTDDTARASITSIEQSKGAASGIATLDAQGKLSGAQVPDLKYSDISYDVATAAYNEATSGAITIDGTKPISIITLTDSATSVAFDTDHLPEVGHTCQVILRSASDTSISIAHSVSGDIRYVCPKGVTPADIEIEAGGYAEISFLRGNDTEEDENVIKWIYVRGI